jgi:hypothetical protein
MSAGAGAAAPEFSLAEMGLLSSSPFPMDKALRHDQVDVDTLKLIENITNDDGIKQILIMVSVIGKDEDKIQVSILGAKKREYENGVWGPLSIEDKIKIGQEVVFSFNGKHLLVPGDVGSVRTNDAGNLVVAVMRIFNTEMMPVGGRRKNKSRRRNRKGRKSQSRRRR